MMPFLLTKRGVQTDDSLRMLARKEDALFHDDFVFMGKWVLGPSKPPQDRPSYRTLQVESAHPMLPVGETVKCTGAASKQTCATIASSVVDSTLPFEPGCLAQVHVTSESMEVVLIKQVSTMGEIMWRAATGWRRWLAYRVGHLDVVLQIDERNLQLLHHPRWEDGEPPRHQQLPRRFLRLHGGWRMNFSGCMHEFDRPIQPLRISYAVRLQAGCGVRSFFNFFLSSAPAPYADEATFWARGPHHPPSPADVFSILFDAHAPDGASRPMLWLPSGMNGSIGQQPALEIGQWHRVTLDFDWRRMRVVCFVGGRLLSCQRGEYSIPFHPHKATMTAATNPAASTDPSDQHAVARQSVLTQLSGFQRLYLFTWLDNPDVHADDAPNVCVADMWIEGDYAQLVKEEATGPEDLRGVEGIQLDEAHNPHTAGLELSNGAGEESGEEEEEEEEGDDEGEEHGEEEMEQE